MSPPRKYRARVVAFALSVLLLAGCSKPTAKLYGALSEHDANEMLLVLRRSHIEATKLADKDGISVIIPESDFTQAMSILDSAGLPRTKHPSVTDLFPAGNMFSSPTEIEIRSRYALEQQIASYLTSIPGVQSAHVILSIPPAPIHGATPPSSASVLLVLDDKLESVGLLARVRQFVRNSVPNLPIANITVSVFRAKPDVLASTQNAPETDGEH